MFLWRLGRGCLPTRIRLLNKGVSTPISCGLCDRDVAMPFTFFLHALLLLHVGKRLAYFHLVEPYLNFTNSFVSWLFQAINLAREIDHGNLAMILCSIWHQRNNKILKNMVASAFETIFAANDFLCTWLTARNDRPKHPSSSTCASAPKWSKSSVVLLQFVH